MVKMKEEKEENKRRRPEMKKEKGKEREAARKVRGQGYILGKGKISFIFMFIC